MRIYLADDHHIVRDGIRLLLETVFDHATFYEAGNFTELLNTIKQDTADDIVLCDLHMPDMDGLEGTKTIRQTFSHIKLIMLSGHFSQTDINQALAFGVDGFVSKTAKGTSLVNIIRLVQAGETYLPSELLNGHQPSGPDALLKTLTNREVEVLSCLAAGYANKLIARQLNVEQSTVKSHVKTIYRKLEVSSRVQAAKLAMTMGVAELEIG